MLLNETEILIIDCQATGANPQSGHLIEIGWGRYLPNPKETSLFTCETYFIELPEDTVIPRHVERVTGIQFEDLSDSIPAAEAWSKLSATAREISQRLESHRCPAVIHYARYETPFLEFLHRQFTPEDPFPFEIVCTHEIVKRLVPGLPRKGLRAVAGYFGYRTPEKRRCGHHLNATLSIWKRVMELLANDHDIRTFVELKLWLAHQMQNRKQCRVFPMDRELRLRIPDASGVYRFLMSNGDLLYIGKAKSLKSRVNSYFQKNRKQPEHVLEMLSQACDIDYTVSDTALEAAILETDEIKRCSPPYNIALRNGDRETGFSAKDFTNHSLKPGNRYTLGPLPSPDSLAPLAILCELTATRPAQTKDISAALSIPDAYAPSLAVFKEGVTGFLGRYKYEMRSDSAYRSFIRLGAMFWKKRLEEADDMTVETDDLIEAGEEEIEDGEWEWTPDAVANAIEGVVRRGVHLIRRARWFCSISESTLVWEDRHETSHRNYLMFHKGVLAEKGALNDGEVIPIPAGYQRTTRMRQQRFDVSTYDRMRVVTTEMRRLLSEGRRVALCLRPNTLMNNKSLKRHLQWI